MDVLATFLSWQFVFFCLAVYAMTTVIRTLVEYIVKSVVKESKFWREAILPILPVILGPVMAILLKIFPYPEGLGNSNGRFIFGLVAGLLCTLLYRMINALLVKKILEVLPAAAPVVAKIEAALPDTSIVTTESTSTVTTELVAQVDQAKETVK